MATTRQILQRAFDESRPRVKMSAKKHEETIDRLRRAQENTKSRSKRDALYAMEDVVDTERYRSSSKREPIPYERQRELGLSRPGKVAGPSVSHEEAYPKMQRKKKGRVTSK